MYYKLGRFDPYDKFVETYKNKKILRIYKMTSEEKTTMTNTLYKIYGYVHDVKEGEKDKNKNKNKKPKL